MNKEMKPVTKMTIAARCDGGPCILPIDLAFAAAGTAVDDDAAGVVGVAA